MKIVSLYEGTDTKFFRSFEKQLKRVDEVEIVDFYNVTAGSDTNQVQAQMLKDAQGVIFMFSADFTADNKLFTIAKMIYHSPKGQEFLSRGLLRVLNLRSVLALGWLANIPTLVNGDVVDKATNQDEIMMKAAIELINIIRSQTLPE